MTTKQLQKADFANFIKIICHKSLGSYDRLDPKEQGVYYKYIMPYSLREKEQYRIKIDIATRKPLAIEDMKNKINYQMI